jgi:HK97 family phage major capsid protein
MSSSGNALWRSLAGDRLTRGGFASRESRTLARSIQALLDQLTDRTISGVWIDFSDPRREAQWLPGRASNRAGGSMGHVEEAPKPAPHLNTDDLCRQTAAWFMRTIGKPEVAERIVSKDAWPLTRASGETTGTAGGYLVPTLMANAIIELRALAGVARREAMTWTMGSDELQVPRRTGGFTAAFIGESSALTESNLTFDMVDLVAKKAAIFARMSSELNEDTAVDFGAWLLTETAWGRADLEDSCLFLGDGSQAYAGIRGLLTRFVDGTHTASVVGATSTHKTALTLTADDLALPMGLLPERYWANAKFYCSGYMAANCFARLAAVGGGFEWEQDTIAGPRPMQSYAGIPIVVTPKMPGTGDLSTKVMVIFGDMQSAVALGSRRELAFLTSWQRYAELDQIAIRCTSRFDISQHSLGDNTSAGPLVALTGTT